MLKRGFWVVALFGICGSAMADQLVLKNGDRLSGSILRYDGKVIVLKTGYAGEVPVDWSAVEQLTSTDPLHVVLKSGRVVAGTVTTAGQNLQVATSAGITAVPKDEIAAVRNDAGEHAYEQSLHPGLAQNWEAGSNIGFALTRGNSQTKNLAVAFTADRKTIHDKIGLYANSVYASNDTVTGAASTTANAVRGGARYDRDINPRLFGFGSADFASDALQALNLRSVFGGGAGLHAIKDAAITLDLLAGLNYTRESYTTFIRNFPAATLGEELTHKLGASSVLSQKLALFPDLSNLGEYRGTADLGTVTKISKWLGWQNSFGDVYVTNPPLGKKKNDIIFTTGLNISLVRPTENGQ